MIELGLPNMLHDDVPSGSDESDNTEVLVWGDVPQYDFEPRDHVDLGSGLGLLDFDAASRISGSRFVVMRGELARLHRALIQYMLDIHSGEHGYEEVYVPFLVQSDALIGTGQLPKFEDDLFKTAVTRRFFDPDRGGARYQSRQGKHTRRCRHAQEICSAHSMLQVGSRFIR